MSLSVRRVRLRAGQRRSGQRPFRGADSRRAVASVMAIGASVATIAALVTGCAAQPAAGSPAPVSSDTQPLRVFATTGHLADAVRTLAPDAAVSTLVGPGGDPHTYQPSTRDIVRMRDADLVVWNGLHLEAQMIDQLESLGERQIAAGDAVPEDLLLAWPQTGADGTPLHDPHIWNSPDAWAIAVAAVADKLAEVDPTHADAYAQRADRAVAEIDAAGAAAAERFAALPAGRRTLVSGHDAFGYLGASYDLDVQATDFISSEAVVSPARLSALADLVVDREVPVIFTDNQANPQAITSLQEAVTARGASVEISAVPLYADSLGSDPGVDTVLGAFTHNTTAIADALSTDRTAQHPEERP